MKISYNVTIPDPVKSNDKSGRKLSEVNHAVLDFLESGNETMQIEFTDATEARRKSANILSFRRRNKLNFAVTRRANALYIIKQTEKN